LSLSYTHDSFVRHILNMSFSWKEIKIKIKKETQKWNLKKKEI